MPAARAGHLGRQRGAKVALIDIARRLTEAIWHMLTTNHPFAPTAAAGGAAPSSRALTAPLELRPRSRPPMTPAPPAEEAIQR